MRVKHLHSTVKHKQKHLPNMNAWEVQSSLNKYLTIIVFLYFNSFNHIMYKNHTESFRQNAYTLAKHLSNVTNH